MKMLIYKKNCQPFSFPDPSLDQNKLWSGDDKPEVFPILFCSPSFDHVPTICDVHYSVQCFGHRLFICHTIDSCEKNTFSFQFNK